MLKPKPLQAFWRCCVQNFQFGSKFKILQNMLKNTLEAFLTRCVQKMALKNA